MRSRAPGFRAPQLDRRARRWVAAAGAAVAATAIVVLFAVVVSGGGPPSPKHRSASAPAALNSLPSPGSTAAPSPTSVPADPFPPSVAGTSCSASAGPGATAPVGLRIPAIGVSTSVIGLGLNADHTLQVPPLNYAGTHEAGWYKLGPAPGQVGSAVIVGHVDSTSGPAVFFRLGSLTPGDMVQVIAANCETSTFVITSVEQYSKNSFPTQLIYGPTSDPELRLITCGGVFDSATGHYLSNIVAYAKTATTA